MIDIQSLTDIDLLEETDEIECKLAAGQDGQGKLPDDFWPTYSAFADTRGGVIILGLKEYKGDKADRPDSSCATESRILRRSAPIYSTT